MFKIFSKVPPGETLRPLLRVGQHQTADQCRDQGGGAGGAVPRPVHLPPREPLPLPLPAGMQALLLLVELIQYCALIGRELQSDEIFSQLSYVIKN